MAKQRERFAAMMLDEEAAAAAPAAAASAEGGAPSSSAEAEAEAVTCIICHEGATESAFGFVGFAQPSCVLRRPEESTGARLHLGLCGHAVHVDCLEKHVASLRQRANANAQFDGRAAVDIQKGEFLCPLCKRLSNTLVPQMCVSADERELAEAVLARAPLPTPPTTLLAQRVLAFRRLLRPHLRRGDPRAEWPGFRPSRPRRRRRRRASAAASLPNVDGAPFGMEAALAGRWRRARRSRPRRRRGRAAPAAASRRRSRPSTRRRWRRRWRRRSLPSTRWRIADVRDNAAQRCEAWAATARMGALADAEGLTEGAAAAVAGAAARRGGNAVLQAMEAQALEAHAAAEAQAAEAQAEGAPAWVQRTSRAMQYLRACSERCLLRFTAAAQAVEVPRYEEWSRAVRRVAYHARMACTTWGEADAPTDDEPFMEAPAIVEQLWMAAGRAGAP